MLMGIGGNSIQDLEEGLEALKKQLGKTTYECECDDYDGDDYDEGYNEDDDQECGTCDKYCPSCEEHYQETDMEYCPYCGEQLSEDF